MTRRSLGGAVIAVTVLACAVIAAEQPPALLRYHWVKGGVTHYRMTLKSDILMSGLPGGMADIHVDQTMAQDIGIAIDDVAADGTATTTQSFDAMKVEMQGPMGTMTFDSAHPEKNGKDPLSAAMGRLFGAMVGRALVVQMASDGAILKVTGASKMLDALRSSAGDDPTFAAAVKVMAGMMDDDAMRNLLAQSFSRLPQKPVGVGDTWTGSMTLNAAAGSPTATSTMSLTSFDGPPDTGLAHIAVSVTMQQGAPVAAPGGATVTIGATKGDGEIVFDVGQGRIERSRMRVDSPASTTAAGPNGPMTLETRTTTTMNMERIDSAAAVSKAPDASGRIQ